jgi:putative Mg2+ transporter-C (MgtC) family protein
MLETAVAGAAVQTWADSTLAALASYGEMLLRLVLAGACGALIGWQREKKDKAAGLRTHMLLALGSCVFTLVGLGMAEGGDILRVVQGTLMGTGFICGGVIFRQGPTVRGLTTAVGLWSLSAVGVAAGAGEYVLAVLGTLAAFVVMAGFYRVEERIEAVPSMPPGHSEAGGEGERGEGGPPPQA